MPLYSQRLVEGGNHMLNEWAVVSVIVVLVGLLITLLTPLLKLNTTITTLAVNMKHQTAEIKTMNDNNIKICNKLEDHEGRLRELEFDHHLK